jgi:hypothetical protein
MEDALPVLKAKIDSTWVTVGGPGVAAGGTTGQLLSKASATDYDTAWTSAPTLGTLGVTGAASVGGTLAVTGDATLSSGLTVTGTLTSKHAVRAAALINGDGSLSSGWGLTSSKISTGFYQITLSSALPFILATVTSWGGAAVFGTVEVQNATNFLVRQYAAGGAQQDGAFFVLVVST